MNLREKDKELINNWYIACLSSELKDNKPIARTVYEKSYVLFRDSDKKPVCMLNRCLHRLTSLDQGRIEDGKLACPYHGWQYNSSGEVVHIPSEGPDSKPQKKFCNPALECIEQDGVIWIWTGASRPTTDLPTWRFPFYNDSKWTKYFMITDFDNEVTNLCENFMDVPHTVFVHKGWFRNKSLKKVPMTVTTKNARVLVEYDQKDDKIGGFFHRLLNPKNAPMHHTDEFIFPNITRVDYLFGKNYGFVINSQNTPVKKLKSRTYTYIAYRAAFANTLIKPFINFYTRQVIEQDVWIMKEQFKSLSLDPTENFRSTDADALHIEIERLRHFGKIGSEKLKSFENIIKKDFWI